MSSAPEVDTYIEALTGARRARIEEVRAAAHRAVPGLIETFEWKMPVFRRGEQWFALASRAQYLSLYIGQPAVDRLIALDPRLKHGKACLNVRDSVPLPMEALEAEIAAIFAGQP